MQYVLTATRGRCDGNVICTGSRRSELNACVPAIQCVQVIQQFGCTIGIQNGKFRVQFVERCATRIIERGSGGHHNLFIYTQRDLVKIDRIR